MKIDPDRLDRMAAAAYDRNMELSWAFLGSSFKKFPDSDLATLAMSEWTKQPEALRENWRECVKAALAEGDL